MRISIIIPTFNEKNIIKENLKHLQNQTRTADEIIYVDESKDETPGIIEKHAKKDKRIKLFHFEEKKGVSFSKNYGAKKATGDIIVFMDADMLPDSNLVEEIEKTFSNPKVQTASWEDYGSTPQTFIEKCYRVRAIHRGETIRDLMEPYAPRCYRRKVFERAGGFNEKLTYFEDTELAKRLFAKGVEVDRINARVIHVDPQTGREFVKQAEWLGESLNWAVIWKKKGFFFKPLGPIHWIAFYSFLLLSAVHAYFFYAFLLVLATILLEVGRCARKSGMLLPSIGYAALSSIRIFIIAVTYLRAITKRLTSSKSSRSKRKT